MIKLSPYHEIFYNEWKLKPDRCDYNIVIDNEMRGDICPVRLQRALSRLSADYFLLHSTIKEIDGVCYWVAQPDKCIQLDCFDKPQTDDELLAYVRTPFNPITDALIRVALVKLADNHFRVVMVIHHMVMDGAKEDFVFKTIPTYYNDETYRFDLSIEQQSNRLNAFSEKYSLWLKDTEDTHQQFWRNQLTDLAGVNLQFLRTSAEQQEITGNAVGECLFTFDAERLKKINYVSKKYVTTPYLLSLSIFSILLFRHTQQEKIGLCIPIAIPDGTEFTYGSNINPSIFAFHLQQTSSLSDVLESTKQHFRTIKSDGHCYFPLQKIPSTLINKDLMEVVFTQATLKNGLCHFQGAFNEKTNASLNINPACKLFFLQEVKNDQIHYRVMFQKQYIDSNLLHSFINTYQRLFIEVLDDLCDGKTGTLISKYSLLDDAQRYVVTQEWNHTETPYPNKTLHQLFEEQSATTPEAIALVYENETWTYAQLNEASNQLAHYLRSNFQIQPDDVIGLCLKPGCNMIMTLWAVLKSGAAYLPIDPAYPDERINYLLNDTKAKAILTDQHSVNRFSHLAEQNSSSVMNLDTQQTKLELIKQSNKNLKPISLTHHLAYVIYTSGTQGQPKGVLLEHHSVVNYVTSVISNNDLSETSVGAKYASFCFDASVIEIYPILLSGGKLCIIKEADRLDCNKVNDFFHQHGVTFAFLPTLFAELFFELENTSLKNLMVGGEKLNRFIPRQYKVINAYGPTETTVQATMHPLEKNVQNIPIGKPINNVQCYVVDSNCNLLPVGSIGELLIGGAGLARKYLNLPDLTAQKFINNLFQSEQEKAEHKNARLYKTGDWVRWLPDGNLEYFGRNDDQVKVRGYRIELSEIEHALIQYSGIKQAIVITTYKPSAPNEKLIAAYYVAQTPLDHANLNNYLSEKFPAYMLPTAYVHIQKMPLLANGKVNKKALPIPKWDDDQTYIVSSNLLEETVCSAYAKILGLEQDQISVHHDFFKLGGNSISAIRLTCMLTSYFKINVMDVFRLRTPAKLALELPLAKDCVLLKSSQIKKLYQNKISFILQNSEIETVNKSIFKKYQDYLQQVEQFNPDTITQKKIQSVLLTGATGFLGCHLLATLLEETPYTIYLPVRSASDAAAFERLQQKFKFYFKADLEDNLNRIKVFASYLDKKNLGLASEQYETIASQVDSIIHCASLVKYYGHDEGFRQANIKPTVNLLDFVKLTGNKDFHYISTVGVVFDGHVTGEDYFIFTEDDDLTELARGNHPYIQSKYIAEQLVIQSRLQGVNGTIYRVGNQAMNSQTHAIQENFEDNMFFAHVKAMMDLKIAPKEMAQMEVSPVEGTALALVKLFDKAALSNQTYHVFNPKLVNLRSVLTYFMDWEREEYSIEKFIEKVMSTIERSAVTNNQVCLFMLYQFWLQQIDGNHTTAIRIAHKKTEHVLAQLGFQWPLLTPVMFSKFITQISSYNLQ